MPYNAQEIVGIMTAEGAEGSSALRMEKYLNHMEQQGWTLVATTTDIEGPDETPSTCGMVILHKPL